jgi:hypothetical protein
VGEGFLISYSYLTRNEGGHGSCLTFLYKPYDKNIFSKDIISLLDLIVHIEKEDFSILPSHTIRS